MNVFGLPPGVCYAELFARGFWERFGDLPPEDIARSLVLINSRRGERVLSDALADEGGVRLMPRLRVVWGLSDDPLQAPDLPPVIDPMRRQLRLTRLVEAFLRREGSARTAPLAAAPELARSLAALLDECDEAGLETTELDAVVPDDHAVHWDRNLKFFDIIRVLWPRIAEEEEGGAMGPKARQRAVFERLMAEWDREPPSAPVVFVGSTGSDALVAMLMAAVARLENGMVVLPGIDLSLDRDIWENVAGGEAPEHPQAPFTRFLGMLDMGVRDVRPWSEERPREDRRRLLAQALRPAPITDAWHAGAEDLSAILDKAVKGMTLLEAPDPRHEAGAVALAVRGALEEPGKKVLILTDDAGLARRIIAELGQFGIEPDESLGRPLAQTPPAVFLRLIAELAEGRAGPVEIAALLSHPLMQAGEDRARHLRHASDYELKALRVRGVSADRKLPDWPEADGDQKAWFDALCDTLAPLIRVISEDAPLGEIVRAHMAAAEALGGSGSETPEIWKRDPGRDMRDVMDRLSVAADAFGDGKVEDYGRLLVELMRNREVRRPVPLLHPRVALTGSRQSRMVSADLVILAGLNEGGWPRPPATDPWLSRPMRAALGLAPPERDIGLSAHGFLQAAMAPEAILSRSLREKDAPATPSRWLTRLEILIDGLDRHRGSEPATVGDMKKRGEEILANLEWIHRPSATLLEAMPPARRPAPRPPVEARPRRLSVTTIEQLIRDPYAVYAQRVLRLAPLDPLGDAPDFRDRGKIVHEILERFTEETTKSTKGALPGDAAKRLGRIADDVLKEKIAAPALRRIWRARVARFAEWFLEGERKRRDGADVAGVEIPGQMDVPDLPGHVITARADRIDRLRSGGAAIYDYKAGAPPSATQIEKGFSQQLHLQAAILAAGGFEGLPKLKAEKGEFIGLTGSGEGGMSTMVGDLSSGVADHLGYVTDLLASYARKETAWHKRVAEEGRGQRGDYDNLSRYGEWGDGESEKGDD